MLKGINRQVVEVKDTGSDCFEKIIFFVKPEYAGMSDGKIRERASMIAQKSAAAPITKAKPNKIGEKLKLLLCALGGIAAGVLISLIFR
ncbi:MAG: hypothetical protein ACI4GC_05615 [Acutalibacteraceae bacterium]